MGLDDESLSFDLPVYHARCFLKLLQTAKRADLGTASLLDSHTVSVRALCNDRRVCLSSVCLSVPRQLSKTKRDIGAKFRHLYRKLGSSSKNMTSDFAPKVAKYLPPNSCLGSMRDYSFAPLAMQLVDNEALDAGRVEFSDNFVCDIIPN